MPDVSGRLWALLVITIVCDESIAFSYCIENNEELIYNDVVILEIRKFDCEYWSVGQYAF